MATIQDTDLLYVQRGATPHNWTGLELKECISAEAKDGKLTVGAYLTPYGQTYDGSADLTINVDGDSAATANKVVIRDTNGDFASGKVTVTQLIANGTGVADLVQLNASGGYISFNDSGTRTAYIQADNANNRLNIVGEDGSNVTLGVTGNEFCTVVDTDGLSVNGTVTATNVATAKGLTLKPSDGTGGLYVMQAADNTKTAVSVLGNGTVTAIGTIQSGDYTKVEGGVAINHAGNVTIRNDSGSAKPFRLFNGGTDEATNLKVSMESDGSITAKRFDTNTYSSAESASISESGTLTIITDSSSESDTQKISVRSGGTAPANATFAVTKAGSVTCRNELVLNSGYQQIYGNGGTTNAFQVYKSEADKTRVFNIQSDGAVTAVGNITCGYSGSSDTDTGTTLNANGQLYVKTRVADTAIQVVNAGDNSNSVLVSGGGEITASAEYKVKIRPYNSANAGQLWVEDPSGTTNFVVDGKGEVVAKSNLTAQSIRTDSTGGQITANYNLVTESTSDSHGLYIGNANGDGVKANSTAWIDGAGQAYYTGSVTATGGFYGNIQGNVTGKADDSAKLNGHVESTSATANTIVERNASGDITGRYIFSSYCNMSHGAATANSDTIFYSSTDDYIRKNTATGFRSSLNVPDRSGGGASGTWGISISGNAATSSAASTVTVNNSDSDSTYLMLWHSGNSVYSTNGVYCNPSSDSFYANGWHYTTGNNGFYNNTHGGGWNMEDTTWFRIYNSKALYVNNSIAATSNVTAYYSDERLKEKTGDIKNAVKKVCAIDTMYYKHNHIAKEMGYKGDEQQIGVTAQSVKKVAPETVSLAPIDMHTNEDGTIVSKTGEDYMTVDYSKLVPLLIESVKEQQRHINRLEKRIKSLES